MQCQLKSAANVIGANSKLLLSVAKAGHPAVKLARDSYFGEDVVRVSTVSVLPKDKMKNKPYRHHVSSGSKHYHSMSTQVLFNTLHNFVATSPKVLLCMHNYIRA